MKTETEEIVFDTDDKAAKLMTITGWVSRHGKFFGDNEDSARYDGCTHKKCDCGRAMTKGWTKCESCRSESSRERYMNLPFQEWDGATPVCIHNDDTYFFNAEEIDDYLDEHELEDKDLVLVICKPNHTRQIETDYWEDELPEDGDLPKELKEKLDELNKFIEGLEPLSWSPSKIRTEYKRVD